MFAITFLPRKLPRLPIPAAAVAMGVFFILLLCLSPKWQVRSIVALDSKDRFDRENEARKTLSQILGGLILLVGFFLICMEPISEGRSSGMRISPGQISPERTSPAQTSLEQSLRGQNCAEWTFALEKAFRPPNWSLPGVSQQPDFPPTSPAPNPGIESSARAPRTSQGQSVPAQKHLRHCVPKSFCCRGRLARIGLPTKSRL